MNKDTPAIPHFVSEQLGGSRTIVTFCASRERARILACQKVTSHLQLSTPDIVAASVQQLSDHDSVVATNFAGQALTVKVKSADPTKLIGGTPQPQESKRSKYAFEVLS